MGNLLTPFKRFLSNKNTVTILGVLLGIVVLYIGYNMRVKDAVNPVSVPYAKVEIASRTQITAEMIGVTEVPRSMLKNNDNLIQNSDQVVGKYVAYSATIPKNSLFYKSVIMEGEEMPDSAFKDIPDGYGVFSLNVDLHSTLGNSIYPHNTIDLYMKAIDDDGKLIFGKFIESIEVQAVKDSKGQHVFETTVETRTPSELLFYVPEDLFVLLNKASYISSNSIEIIPVPRNENYSANPGETQVSSEYLRNFIIRKSTILPDVEQ